MILATAALLVLELANANAGAFADFKAGKVPVAVIKNDASVVGLFQRRRRQVDVHRVDEDVPPPPLCPTPLEHHKMSLVSLIINIVADLAPHGMLPLAYGLSQGGPSGLIPSLGLVLTFGAASLYTMTIYAKLADEKSAKSIGGIWSRVMDPQYRWLVDLSILTLTIGCCVFYSAFIGDILGAVVSGFGVGGLSGKRSFVLSTISAVVLLPLCLLEDLSALKYTSVAGVLGILYTVAFHILRLVDGTYAEGSPTLATISEKLRPKFPASTGRAFNLWTVNSGTLVLANMLCVGFLAHYNCINYWRELQNATQERFSVALKTAYGISLGIFVVMMLVGYKLFGLSTQPLILNNFSRTSDNLATLARLATGAAITFAYPLMFAAVKSSLKSLIASLSLKESEDKDKAGFKLFKRNEDGPVVSKTNMNAASIAIVVFITAVAIKCSEDDVSVVLGLLGSVIGCTVAYILPGVLNLVNMRSRKKLGLKNSLSDVIACHLLVPMGAIFGALGVWVTLSSSHESEH